MKKKGFLVGFTVLLIFAMSIHASAAEARLGTTRPTLTFKGTTTYCSVTITAADKEIDATLELWRGDTLVDSWAGDGTTMVNISGQCKAAKGVTYTLVVTGTVDGKEIPTMPTTKTC